MGGITGGWSLYAKDGKAKHCYNFFGLEQVIVEGKTRLPEGRHQVRIEFAYDGGGPAKGGKLTLYLDGKPDGEGRIERPSRSSSRPTRPATSAPNSDRLSPRTTIAESSTAS